MRWVAQSTPPSAATEPAKRKPVPTTTMPGSGGNLPGSRTSWSCPDIPGSPPASTMTATNQPIPGMAAASGVPKPNPPSRAAATLPTTAMNSDKPSTPPVSRTGTRNTPHTPSAAPTSSNAAWPATTRTSSRATRRRLSAVGRHRSVERGEGLRGGDLVAEVDHHRRRLQVHLTAGTLEHCLDLATDELVPLDERVAQRRDQVLVVIELCPDERLLLLKQLFHASARVAVAEDPADEVGVVERACLHGCERHQRARHACRTDHLRGDVGRVREVTAGTGRDVTEEQLLGALSGHGDLDQRE